MAEEGSALPKPAAVIGCAGLTLFYVGILYSPTLILRLPPPASFKSYLIRRFICAAVSSVVSLIACAFILPIKGWGASIRAYGIRFDNIFQAVVFPFCLTSLMYAGSFVLKSLVMLNSWKQLQDQGSGFSLDFVQNGIQNFGSWIFSIASNVSAWRNYFVAPLTEELVFRACMIPLLLCGGFKTILVLFLCPIFFSLAHLNHFLEFYIQQNRSLLQAVMAIGLQLGYTVVFGSYASFLFIRTGHLIAPLVAHIFCNMMGLPAMFSRKTGLVSVAFIAGVVGFFWLLFPLTTPGLYNDRTDNCHCWHRYCSWS